MDFNFTLFVLVVGLAVSVGGVLLLVGYIDSVPTSFAFGWRWGAAALLLPVVGPIAFCLTHWQDCARPGKQLMIGSALVLVAVLSLYGLGPYFVARMAPGASGG